MKPLTTWTCDTCGEQVEPKRGVVLARWTPDEDRRLTGFIIVHKNIDGRHCDPGNASGYRWNVDLHTLLGQDGMANLLAYLSAGPLKGGGGASNLESIDEFIDLFRRLQVPYYEQARHRFGDEDVTYAYGDANEYFPYMPDQLERIAKNNPLD